MFAEDDPAPKCKQVNFDDLDTPLLEQLPRFVASAFPFQYLTDRGGLTPTASALLDGMCANGLSMDGAVSCLREIRVRTDAIQELNYLQRARAYSWRRKEASSSADDEEASNGLCMHAACQPACLCLHQQQACACPVLPCSLTSPQSCSLLTQRSHH